MQVCTIVVIALRGGVALQECLAALTVQGAPCLVALGPAMGSPAAWQHRFPAARFLDCATASVPVRRMLGIVAADAEFVGLLEDTSIPGPGWYAALASAFATVEVAAVGGPVTIGPDIGHRGQALGCCEYGAFHPALQRPSGHATDAARGRPFAVERLPGNNLALRTSALRAVDVSRAALVETELFMALRAAGFMLAFAPAMTVEFRPPDARGTHWRDRFRHGRLYGGNHAAGAAPLRRLLLLGKTLLLPVILSLRTLRRMTVAVPRHDWIAVGALICWMETAWALGEAAGTISGVGRGVEEWTG